MLLNDLAFDVAPTAVAGIGRSRLRRSTGVEESR